MTRLSAPALPAAWRDARLEPVRFDVQDLDWSIRPQDDLDGFVNARWQAANPVPPEHGCWDCFTILREHTLRRLAAIADSASRGELGGSVEARIVGDFWATGLDEGSSAHALALLAGEFRRIDAIGDRDALAAYLRDSHARGSDPLFRIEARPDYAEPSQRIAFVTPRESALPDPAAWRDDSPAGERRRAAWLDHAAALLQLSGLADGRAAAADLPAFERRLAAALPARAALARDAALGYHPVDVVGAEAIAPGFSWRKFFDAASARPWRLSLAIPAYHVEVDRLIQDGPLPTWRALLRLRAAQDAAPYLGRPWRNAHERFHGAALRGRTAVPPAWKRALAAIDSHAGNALGRLYAQQHGSPQANDRVHALFESLRTALRTRIERLDWLGPATKACALDKLARMRAKVGHPQRWRDESDLATSRHSLYRNVVAARQRERRRQLRRIGTGTDDGEWSLTPQTVNARYDPLCNEILVPSALLQPPFFDAGGDAGQLFGGLGAIVAHEMTHAFDDQGSRFDASGRWCDWWTGDDRARFAALAVRLSESASGWTDPAGERVDGRLTLGENIADFGGLAIAWDAFEASKAGNGEATIGGFSPRQRFFLNWATLWRQNLSPDERRLRARIDVHAPANVRANAAAADLPGYAKAFGCAPGDAMVHRESLGIW